MGMLVCLITLSLLIACFLYHAFHTFPEGRRRLCMPRRYTLPTHLGITDTVLTVGERGLSARQLLIVLVGGSSSYDLWLHLRSLDTWLQPGGLIVHWLPVLLLATLSLVLAFGQIAGQSLDRWALVLLSYLCAPRLYLWRTLCTAPNELRGAVLS